MRKSVPWYAVLLFLLFVLLPVCGQPMVMWKRVITLGGDVHPVALFATRAELVLVGEQENIKTRRAVWFVQYLDKRGNLLRRHPFAPPGYGGAYAAALDSAGNVYIAGTASVQDTELAVFAKLTPAGRVAWQKGLALGTRCTPWGLAVFGPYLGFSAEVDVDDHSRLVVGMFDTSGKTLWTRDYDLGRWVHGPKLAFDPKGNPTVATRVVIPKTRDTMQDYHLLMRLTPAGETLWTRRYDSGYWVEWPSDMVIDRFGNIVVLLTLGPHITSTALLEYTGEGGMVRAVTYSADSFFYGSDLTLSPKEEIFVCGSSWTAENTVDVFEYVPGASVVWQRRIELGGSAVRPVCAVDRDVYLALTVDKRYGEDELTVLRLSRTAR